MTHFVVELGVSNSGTTRLALQPEGSSEDWLGALPYQTWASQAGASLIESPLGTWCPFKGHLPFFLVLFLFLFEGHLVVLRCYSWLFVQELPLLVGSELNGILGIEPGRATCKVNALTLSTIAPACHVPFVPSLQTTTDLCYNPIN